MRIARLFVLCFSLLGLPVFAATVPNLYQVHEPVSSQQPGERDAGLVRALQTLLVRLTGNPQAPQNPALAGYLKDPQQLISQYAFENGPPLALVVDFDPTATGNALRAAGLPSWGANRPAVLAWWLNESADGSSWSVTTRPRPNRSSVRRRTAACRCACLWRISTNRSSVPRKPHRRPTRCPARSLRALCRRCLAGSGRQGGGRQMAGAMAAVDGRFARARPG